MLELAGFLADHASLLRELHRASGAERWALSCEEFAAWLHRSAARHFGASQASSQDLENYLRALHLEDLALACALRRGCEPAWEQFVRDYRPVLRSSARAIVGAGGDERARELADSLYAELYGLDRSGGQRKSSLLDYFHGRSKFSTWLRSVLAQRHVDALRVSQRTQPLEEDPALEQGNRQSASSAFENMNPDRVRLLPLLAAAVSAAVAALPAADRLLLTLYYVQSLTLAQIARMQGVHEATASRCLQSVRVKLRGRVEQILVAGGDARDGLPERKGLSPEEVRACLEYASEDWAFDLAPALAGKDLKETGGENGHGLQERRPVSFKGKDTVPDGKPMVTES